MHRVDHKACGGHAADVDAFVAPDDGRGFYAPFRRDDVGVGAGVGGLALSAYVDVPCSALIVIMLAAMFIGSRCGKWGFEKFSRRIRGVRE